MSTDNMEVPSVFNKIMNNLQEGSGGSLGLNQFASNSTQAGWVTVFIFLLLWFVSLLLIPLFRQFGKRRAVTETSAGAEGDTANKLGWGDRIVDAGRAARDAYLVLLGTALINMAGHGLDSSVTTLLWITMGLQFLWWLQFLFFYNPFIDLTLLTGWITLSIINFALAFRDA